MVEPSGNQAVTDGKFTSETGRIEGSKGGRNTTEKKAFANSWRRRKYCTKICSIWETCPLMPASMKQKDNKNRHPCLLKQSPQKMQNRIFNLFVKGEDGIVDELRRILHDIGEDVDMIQNAKLRLAFFDKAKDFKEVVYGKMIKQQVSGELKTGGFTAEDFQKTFEELYGTKGDAKKQGSKDAVQAPVRDRHNPDAGKNS